MNKKGKKCYYCEKGERPDYKQVAELKKFVFEDGRMKSARSTGLCGKHQRMLKRAIANAHQLALM